MGFLLAEEKCDWEPKQTAIWLGYQFDSCNEIIRVTDERIDRSKRVCQEILKSVSLGNFLDTSKTFSFSHRPSPVYESGFVIQR